MSESAVHLRPGCNSLYEPATDELKSLRASMERATGCKILFVREMPEDIKQTERAIEAAALAAGIVFHDANPDGEWVVESKEARDELIRLCGLAAWHPYKSGPCPLSEREQDAALGYIRKAFEALPTHPSRELAIAYMKWAKECAAS